MTREEVLAMVLDNTQPIEKYDELGILRFGKLFFPDLFNTGYSKMHYDMCHLLFELWNPERERRVDRQAYFLCHREASKSTVGSFLLPIYSIFLKGYRPWVRYCKEGWEGGTGIDKYDYIELPAIKENFIVIASETASSSEFFVIDIKNAIQQRQDLANMFGEKSPEMMTWDDARKGDDMWRKNAFITSDDTAVIGIGSGQQIRGRKIRGNRPSLIIVDDMYSRKNTKTEVMREHLNNWFYSELINSADTIEGKILWLGTAVNPDTVITKMQKSEEWFGVEKPIISEEELQKALTYCITDNKFTIPDKTVLRELESGFTSLSWKERHNLYGILKIYKEKRENSDLNYFYQEYMNQTIAPENNRLAPDTFVQLDMVCKIKKGVQIIEFEYQGHKWSGEANLHIGVDIASSLADSSDETAIFVAGYARCFPVIEGYDIETAANTVKGGRIFPVIVHVEGGRYDVHAYEGRKGVTETLHGLCQKYKIGKAVVEAQGQQALIVREIRRYFRENGLINVPVTEEYVNMDKKERISSVLLPIVQTYKHILAPVNPLIHKTFIQLQLLGIADHDDYPDALEECFKYVRPPAKREQFDVNNPAVEEETRYQKLRRIYGKDAWLYL